MHEPVRKLDYCLPPAGLWGLDITLPVEGKPNCFCLTSPWSTFVMNGKFESITARMSNCARQVKKLEQSRNERRLKFEEAKQEKQKQMNADPGNPNWHFLAMIRDYRATLDFTPLGMGEMAHDKPINVCIRKRPLNKKGNNGPIIIQ